VQVLRITPPGRVVRRRIAEDLRSVEYRPAKEREWSA